MELCLIDTCTWNRSVTCHNGFKLFQTGQQSYPRYFHRPLLIRLKIMEVDPSEGNSGGNLDLCTRKWRRSV